MLCLEPIQRRRPSAASTKGGGLRSPPFVVSFVLALNKAHVLALNTAHVLRLNKADVLALNKAHVLRLDNKICPVFRANAKEAAFGCPPPFVVSQNLPELTQTSTASSCRQSYRMTFFRLVQGRLHAKPYFLRPYLEGDLSEIVSKLGVLDGAVMTKVNKNIAPERHPSHQVQ